MLFFNLSCECVYVTKVAVVRGMPLMIVLLASRSSLLSFYDGRFEVSRVLRAYCRASESREIIGVASSWLPGPLSVDEHTIRWYSPTGSYVFVMMCGSGRLMYGAQRVDAHALFSFNGFLYTSQRHNCLLKAK